MKHLSTAVAAVIFVAGLFVPARIAAQVDWSDLFPDEQTGAAKPRVPPPVVKAAPAPVVKAAPPPVRVAPRAAVKAPPPVPDKAAAKAPQQPRQAAAKAAAPPRPRVRPTARVARIAPRPPVVPAPPEPVAPAVEAPPAAAAAESYGVRLAELGLREGDLINAGNVHQYASYLSPGVQWCIGYGWRLVATEARPIRLLRAYREATEKYSGQVRLGKGGLTLVNYVAGQPFPNVDPADPDAAQKIMWNFYYGGAYTDDIDIRLYDADTGSIGPARPMVVDRHYIINHLRRLYYNGRLFVDPKPVFPNDEGFRYKESLQPLLEPFDLKGVGFVAYRYLDPSRQDDTWLYLPQLRRVRRLSSAQRSDALFGQDTDVDSYYGYNGHVAWSDYKLLGEQTILATMHAKNFPVKWQEPEDYFYDDAWEPRRVWVVEARSKLAQYAYSKRVIYIDKEAYVIPYSDIYDRAGQLWKIWVNQYGYRKEAMPGAKLAVYDEEMAFSNAVVMIDMQLAHATRAALPSTKTRAEEGWFINLGEASGTTEEFFTIAHMIETGH